MGAVRRCLADPRLRRVLTDGRLLAYAAWMSLATPFAVPHRALRRWRRRRRGERLSGVVGIAPTSRNEAPGPRVVFSGAGYGEFIMMERVARALQARRPDVSVAYALRDAPTTDDLRRKRPDLRIVPTAEPGLFGALRWLDRERPGVVVLVESAREPLLVVAASRYGARVALMNGRARPRRGLKARLGGVFYRWANSGFRLLAMRSEEDRRNLAPWAPPQSDLRLTGEIKLDLLPPEPNPSLDAWLTADLPIVAAGSTETTEEEAMVLSAFARIRDRFACRLLLAPRRPTALDAVLENLRASGLTFSRRTNEGAPAEVMVLDTMGELAGAYGRTRAAYVGGSFTQGGGGHNVAEPLLSGVPVAYGLQRGHFREIQALCEANGVGTRIAGAEELAAFWARFLGDPADRERVGEAGRQLLEAHRGAIRLTVEGLLPLLDDSA